MPMRGVADDVARFVDDVGFAIPKGGKFARFTEEDLLSAPSRLKIPNVKVKYIDDLLDNENAYGICINGDIFVQSVMNPNITRGIIRHDYGHLI